MAAKPKVKKPPAEGTPMTPPPGGAVVRMYRIGHGDCFLIAFAGESPERPIHVLIDCGYKPRSPKAMTSPTDVKDIGADIIATTGGFVDVAIVTHEHQDHVNGLTSGNFPNLKVGKVWFAWTENPDDNVANKLRAKFHDRLLGLIDTQANLPSAGEDAKYIASFLELELGEEPYAFKGRDQRLAAGKDPARSANKIAMKFLRGCSTGDADYLYPHGKPRSIPGAASARAFVLGPPRDIDRIDDLDPIGDENFGDEDGDHPVSMAALTPAERSATASPFSRRHVIPFQDSFRHEDYGTFFKTYYGIDGAGVAETANGAEIAANAPWRRLGDVGAQDAGALALAMNNATNNSSLVLAFELSKGGKVLLFAGDAQAGNWRSWSDAAFDDGGETVTTRDLLARTVLYKVGHHGSHNATLNGKIDSDHPNLAWLAAADGAGEFAAMITAVEAWAHHKSPPPWNHPLPAIKKALLQKTGGRVFQTDTTLKGAQPTGAGAATWQSFLGRVRETELFFDLTIEK